MFVPLDRSAATQISVRVHIKFEAGGKLTARNLEWMITEDKAPEIVFMRDELATKNLTLIRNAIISVEPGEAYTVDRLKPPDDITVTAVVAVMRPEDTVDLPVPEDV